MSCVTVAGVAATRVSPARDSRTTPISKDTPKFRPTCGHTETTAVRTVTGKPKPARIWPVMPVCGCSPSSPPQPYDPGMAVLDEIARERMTVADLLDTLTPEQLATRSSCGEWSVHTVG